MLEIVGLVEVEAEGEVEVEVKVEDTSRAFKSTSSIPLNRSFSSQNDRAGLVPSSKLNSSS